jgi:O-antigen/teichoic acid export membrane protein
MRGIGKISLYLYSDVIWIFGYIVFMRLFIPRFGVQGVGIAYLSATIITLGFNFGYVVRFHTELKIDIKFFYKIIVFSLIFGVISYFVWQYILDGLRWKLLFLFLFVGLGYFMFLLWANIFGTIEKERLKNLFLKRYKLSE